MYSLPITCVDDVVENFKSQFVVMDAVDLEKPSYQTLTIDERKLLTETTTAPEPLSFFGDFKKTIKFDPAFGTRYYKKFASFCTESNSRTMLLEGIGDLPSRCTSIGICNKDKCVMIPKTSMALASLTRRSQFARYWGLDTPTPCRITNYHRIAPRAAIPIHDYLFDRKGEEQNEKIAAKMFNSTYGIMTFNLPGYRYCGPGTDVEKMDDAGGPMNELDDLCREHDVDYLLGVNPNEADARFLNGIWKIGHPYLPLFVSIFESKRHFEKLTGNTFTSSLYYIPSINRQSLTYYLADRSSYDSVQFDSSGAQLGRNLDKKWKNLLHDIWRGYCFQRTSSPLLTKAANGDDQCSPQPGSSAASAASSSAAQIDQDVSMEEENLSDSTMDSIPIRMTEIPDPPDVFGPCRMIIGELVPKYGLSYLELQRVCPINLKSKKKLLNGYHLVVVRAGNPSTIYMSHSLDNANVHEVEETKLDSKRKEKNGYFVLGSTSNLQTTYDVYFNNIDNMVTPDDLVKGLPFEYGSTFAVLLLFFPVTAAAQTHRELLHMNRDNHGNAVETNIGEIQWNIFNSYLQDTVIYGDGCPLQNCRDLLSLLPSGPQVSVLNDVYIPMPYIVENDNTPVPTTGLSRCSFGNAPFQIDEFVIAEQTPRARNKCPTHDKNTRFDMRGFSLQSTAQKIILNVDNFFQRAVGHPEKFLEDSRKLTCDATGLGEATVKKVVKNWKDDLLVTPGKKRNNPFRVQDRIDSFYTDMIRRIIQDSYKANVAPLFFDIFRSFMDGVKKSEEDRISKGEDVDPLTISERTFRKVLRKLGYRFAKINQRDSVLMRPDLVMLRGKYLTAIRKNDQSSNPLHVVYVDETWIDPHSRTGKAWVKAKCKDYRERALYTFARNKVSRGPRIIILNAGGNDGFINNVMAVYKVSKRKADGDYHNNVDAAYYESWFKKLLDELDKTGKKYLIVQDNAPYHGATSAVKSSDLKHTMYTWLKNNLPANEAQALLAEREYYKWELWDKAKKLKKEKNFYKIDQMAAERGHRVTRLSPYNCDLNPIEEVWKDVKHEVRSKNRDQNLDSVMTLARDAMLNYPIQKWKNHVAHIKKLEEEYWVADGFFDGFLEANRVRIHITDDDDDSDVEDTEGTAVETDPDVIRSVVHEEELINDDDDELLDI